MADPKLVEYIRASQASAKPKEEIYKELLSQGWTISLIEEGFKTLEPSQVETKHEKEDASKKTINLILMIAALLVAAGIFSFIAANWKDMTRELKVLLILVSMLLSYGSGWYFKEKSGYTKTGDALIFLGAIIYGAGIFLIAQMFNIRANWPDGFILWMIGTIAVAFVSEVYPLFSLAIVLGGVAMVGHPFGILSGMGHNSFLLTSSFLLLAATIITFFSGWVIYKKTNPESREFY